MYFIGSFVFWTILYLGSRTISRLSSHYRGLPRKLQLGWDSRVVAFCHAIFILQGAFRGTYRDRLGGKGGNVVC